MQKTALRAAGSIFFLVAVLHLARAVWGVAIDVGPIVIPAYFGWPGSAIALLLSVWMFAASKK